MVGLVRFNLSRKRAMAEAIVQRVRIERLPPVTQHAKGYKDNTLTTRRGRITVAVPQVREGRL